MYVDYPDWRDAKYNSDQFLCFRKDGGKDRQKQGFRLFALHHSLNISLKKYFVLVIQYSQLYINSSRTHIYSISYSISTNISYPLSSLSLSSLLSPLSFSLLPFHRRAHRNLARGERDAWFSVLLYRPEPCRLVYRRAVQKCTRYIWRPVGFAGARCAQPYTPYFAVSRAVASGGKKKKADGTAARESRVPESREGGRT
jgi:hypothetical protein